jgi:hypothetical protein
VAEARAREEALVARFVAAKPAAGTPGEASAGAPAGAVGERAAA